MTLKPPREPTSWKADNGAFLQPRIAIPVNRKQHEHEDWVEKEEIDLHEELQLPASLPPPSTPQGVGRLLPQNGFHQIDHAQVFQRTYFCEKEQYRGDC